MTWAILLLSISIPAWPQQSYPPEKNDKKEISESRDNDYKRGRLNKIELGVTELQNGIFRKDVTVAGDLSVGDDLSVVGDLIITGITTQTSSMTILGNLGIYGPRPWADINAYGAKCNGTFDDTSSIQSALTALQTTGGTVLIPLGNCYINQGRLTYSSTQPVAIMGLGWGSKLTWNAATDSPAQNRGMLNISGLSDPTTGHAPYVLISNLSFDFGASSTTAYDSYKRGVNIYNADNIYVLNNYFKGARAEMLGMGNFGTVATIGTRARIQNNYFYDFAQDGVNPNVYDADVSFNIFDTGDTPVEGGRTRFTAIGNVIRGMGGNFKISSINDFVVSGNRFEECAITNQNTLAGCIHIVDGGGGSPSTNGIISNNTIINDTATEHGNMAGISAVRGAITTDNSRISITGNNIRRTKRGIRLESCLYCSVTNNRISDMAGIGIEIPDSVQVSSTVVFGNYLQLNSVLDIDDVSLSTRNITIGLNWVASSTAAAGFTTKAPIYFSNDSGNNIFSDTTDGQDTKIVQIGGGGKSGTDRGAYANFFGNEYSVTPSQVGKAMILSGRGSGAGSSIEFYTDVGAGNVLRSNINSGGNFAIGVTTANALLDVEGNAQFGTAPTKSTFATTGALSLATQLTVPNGGTGATSFTANGVLVGSGTLAVGALPSMAAGGLVIGNSVGQFPSTGTLTGNAALTVTNSAGSIALSLNSSSATLAGPLVGVSQGGTGSTSFNAGGVFIGSGTLAATSTPSMANGGVVIGRGIGLVPSTGTISGTSNQIVVANGAGTITLSTPQNIATGSSPQFANVTLSGAALSQTTSDGSDNSLLQVSGGGAAGSDRGGYVNLFGNEQANSGKVQFNTGIGNKASFEFVGDSGGGGVLSLYISSAAITTGSALCINADKKLTVCTGSVGGGGACTCP